MVIVGRCHCGNVSFSLDWQPQPTEIPARACSCTFCRRHGGVWTSCPTGALEVRIGQPERVHAYEFGTRTARFHVCTGCGIVPVVTSEIAGRLYAVVNVNTFENVDPALLRPATTSFDGENEAERLARRQDRWIGRVVLSDATESGCHAKR